MGVLGTEDKQALRHRPASRFLLESSGSGMTGLRVYLCEKHVADRDRALVGDCT
jgi:hypothetical protein